MSKYMSAMSQKNPTHQKHIAYAYQESLWQAGGPEAVSNGYAESFNPFWMPDSQLRIVLCSRANAIPNQTLPVLEPGKSGSTI